MGGLSGTKPHVHPRLDEPVSKVLPMYRYIVAKQYYALNTVFKLLQVTKIEI